MDGVHPRRPVPPDGPAPDLGGYVPWYLNTISNKISASASRAYLRRFGVGIAEWRVLSNMRGGVDATAQRIAQVTGMDKSAVSRAVAALARQEYVVAVADPADQRRRALRLTGSGVQLRAAIRDAALAREQRLLSGLSAAERTTLLGLLRRVLDKVPDLAAD